MQRLVDDLLTLARPLAGARDLSVGGPAVIAEVDADRIRQVLVNPGRQRVAGTRAIAARSGSSWAPGASGVRIEVTDDGEGMDEATRARAFTGSRGTDNRSGRGSGLGLREAEGRSRRLYQS